MKGPVQIVVLGKEGVGKTALVVRFLTRRYLTEYAHGDEVTYERAVAVDERQVVVRITDVSGKTMERRSSAKETLSKMDGIIVVYSVSDRESYDVAEAIVDWLKRERKSAANVPIMLLGNKSDLDHMRVVSRPNLEYAAAGWSEEGLLASECSACDDAEGVANIFTKFIRKVLERKDPSSKSQRKMSHATLGSPKQIRATLRRRFSVFSRERTSTM